MSIAFLLTTLIVVVSPGTGAIYTMSAGLSRGWRASLVAAFGCTLGIVPHIAAAMLGLAAVLSGETIAHPPSTLSILLLAFQSVWVVGTTFTLWFGLVKTYSASKLSAFTFITPLFGVAAGYFIMHDHLTLAFGIAALLVIAGLYLVNRPSPPVIDPLLNVTKT